MVVTSAIQRAALALGISQDGQRAQQRHEGDRDSSGKAHSAPPETMNQVASATTPSSIASA